MTDASANQAPAGPTYALLTESLDDEHEVAVLRGVLSAARDADATILCVPGGNLEDPDPERRARNFAFGAVSEGSVDGVLVMSSAMGNTVGPGGLAKWLDRLGTLPCVAIGVPIAGRPSVEVDNAGGMRALVLHLTREHGAQRLGFIRGPAGSVEAEQRLQAFRDALSEEGLELDERWITDGDYTKPAGALAVRALLDERRIPAASLDALVCANDFMALGAVEELGRRGLHVPEDLAVAGFDDVDSARTAHPALTTVRQRGEQLGREGLRTLKALVENEAPKNRAALPTELVVRRSCGCLPDDVGLASQASALPGRGVETSFVQRRQIILAEVVRASQGRFGAAGAGWDSRLLDALVGELRSGEVGGFMRALEHHLRRLEYAKGDVSVVQDVLTALRRQSLPCVAADLVARGRLEQALHDARVAAAAFSSQLDATRVRAAVERVQHFERRLRSALIQNPGELARVAEAELPALGIEACAVARFDQPGEPGGPATLVFGFGRGGSRAGGEPLGLSALASHGILERTSKALVALPITLGATPLGLLVVSVTHVDGALLEDVREFFAGVLGTLAYYRRL